MKQSKILFLDNSASYLSFIKTELADCSIEKHYFSRPILFISYIESIKQDKNIILFIDYDMPRNNGLEICEKYVDQSVLKVLVTEETKNKKIARAMDSKIIDQYIWKSEMQFIDQMKQIINDAAN